MAESAPQLIPHLFRAEYSKLVAVLCRTYGLDQIEVAEDIVSETFLKAVETWASPASRSHGCTGSEKPNEGPFSAQ